MIPLQFYIACCSSDFIVLPSLSRMSATLLFTIWCWCALFSGAATPLTLLSLSGAITTSHFLIHRLVVEGAGNGGYAAARTLRCTLHPPNLTAVHQIFIHRKAAKMGKTMNAAKGRDTPTHVCNYTSRLL